MHQEFKNSQRPTPGRINNRIPDMIPSAAIHSFAGKSVVSHCQHRLLNLIVIFRKRQIIKEPYKDIAGATWPITRKKKANLTAIERTQ
jgi:hypothetical protein